MHVWVFSGSKCASHVTRLNTTWTQYHCVHSNALSRSVASSLYNEVILYDGMKEELGYQSVTQTHLILRLHFYNGHHVIWQTYSFLQGPAASSFSADEWFTLKNKTEASSKLLLTIYQQHSITAPHTITFIQITMRTTNVTPIVFLLSHKCRSIIL
jgi:hypothetical protein